MGGGGDQDQMTAVVPGQTGNQPVALVPETFSFTGKGAGVGLVHDHQLRAGSVKLVAPAIGFNKVSGDNHKGIVFEKRLAYPQVSLQAADRTGQHQFRVNMKFVSQFHLPLFGQRRGAQYSQALNLAAIQQLAGNQSGFDGFSDTHIIGNQNPDRILFQGDQQRNQLIRPGVHSQPAKGSKGSGAGAKPQAHRIAKQITGVVVARRAGIGKVKTGLLHRLQRQVNAGDITLAAPEGP